MNSPSRAYAEGFFPADDNILANRGTWTKWFDDKSKILDSRCISIENWINNSPIEDEAPSDNELIVVDDSDSSADDRMQIQRNYNLQLKPFLGNELSSTLNLIKHYYDEIVNTRLVKWQKTGLDRLLPPASKKVVAATQKVNNWFDNFDSFKGNVKIKETCCRTIMISRDLDSESDSVDTAEYIRAARGKGNKLISKKNKNRLIKKYSYVNKIESNKLLELKRNKKKMDPFPLDNDADSNSPNPMEVIELRQSKKSNNKQHFPQDKIETAHCNNIKVRRKRLQRQSKRRKSRSSSSSSSCEELYRRQNSNNNSRSVRLLNRTHISSDVTDNSDPDDRILDIVRKTYKEVEKPVQVNSHYTLNKTAEPIIEFPPEPELQLAVYDEKCVPNRPDVILLSSCEEEDSETDILFMSDAKRSRLYGKCIEEQPNNNQALVLYNRSPIQQNNSDETSTDDGLFKMRNYET